MITENIPWTNQQTSQCAQYKKMKGTLDQLDLTQPTLVPLTLAWYQSMATICYQNDFKDHHHHHHHHYHHHHHHNHNSNHQGMRTLLATPLPPENVRDVLFITLSLRHQLLGDHNDTSYLILVIEMVIMMIKSGDAVMKANNKWMRHFQVKRPL